MAKARIYDESTQSWIVLDAGSAESISDGINTITPDSIGFLNTLATNAKSSVVDAINELKLNGSYKMMGNSTFNSTTGRIINHTIGNTNYTVLVSPSANPNGFLGEVWVEKASNNFKICCSGSATTPFDYIVF